VLGKITKDGVFLEELEANPGQFLPEVTEDSLDGKGAVDVVRVHGCLMLATVCVFEDVIGSHACLLSEAVLSIRYV
jgi:hypothetical protein